MYRKKRRIVISTTQSQFNLKSNTMKNTMQRYCFFAYQPNNLSQNYVIEQVFHFFAQLTLQNFGIFDKNLVLSKNSSNFVPDKICVNGQLAQNLQRIK